MLRDLYCLILDPILGRSSWEAITQCSTYRFTKDTYILICQQMDTYWIQDEGRNAAIIIIEIYCASIIRTSRYLSRTESRSLLFGNLDHLPYSCITKSTKVFCLNFTWKIEEQNRRYIFHVAFQTKCREYRSTIAIYWTEKKHKQKMKSDIMLEISAN